MASKVEGPVPLMMDPASTNASYSAHQAAEASAHFLQDPGQRSQKGQAPLCLGGAMDATGGPWRSNWPSLASVGLAAPSRPHAGEHPRLLGPDCSKTGVAILLSPTTAHGAGRSRLSGRAGPDGRVAGAPMGSACCSPPTASAAVTPAPHLGAGSCAADELRNAAPVAPGPGGDSARL